MAAGCCATAESAQSVLAKCCAMLSAQLPADDEAEFGGQMAPALAASPEFRTLACMKKGLLVGALMCAACVGQSANEKFAADVPQRLAKLKPLHMPFHTEGLTKREVAEVRELAHALQLLDDVYWRQIDPEALDMYKRLKASGKTDSAEARYLEINGSRYDLFADNEPFVGTTPQPPGKNFYQPYGSFTSAKELEEYAAAHPEQKQALYSPSTVVKKNGNGLTTVSYHVEYARWLKPAAESLRKAAALSDDPQFAKFLTARAEALLSDDYYASDIQWLDLKSPKIDIIYAPYRSE